MQKFVTRRDWNSLEVKYARLCEDLSGGGIAKRIRAVKTTSYQAGLRREFAKIIKRALIRTRPAVYVEYDLDNGWSTYWSVIRSRRPRDGSLEFIRSTVESHRGLGFKPFASLYREGEPGYLNPPARAGRTLYLLARTLAAAGRAVESIPTHGIAVYFTHHESDTIYALSEERVARAPEYSVVSETTRKRVLKTDAQRRTARIIQELGAESWSSRRRLAIEILARLGASIGRYPTSRSGVDYIYLEQTDAGDDALSHVAALRPQHLTLKNTKVTDRGVLYLLSLRRLKSVSLDSTAVTDDALSHLATIPGLKWVSVYDTGVTEVGVSRFKSSRPVVHVHWDGKVLDSDRFSEFMRS